MTSRLCSQVLKMIVKLCGKFPIRYLNLNFITQPLTFWMKSWFIPRFSLSVQCRLRPVYLRANRNKRMITTFILLHLQRCIQFMHPSKHHNLVTWRPVASNPSSWEKCNDVLRFDCCVHCTCYVTHTNTHLPFIDSVRSSRSRNQLPVLTCLEL